MRKLFLASFLLFISAPMFAANGWFSNPNCTVILPAGVLTQNAYFCVDSAAVLNGFSPVLGTRGLLLYVTRTGDRGQLLAGLGEVKVFETLAVSGTTITVSTGLDQRGADVDGDGIEDTLSLNGAVSRGAINGFTAVGLTLQVTALPAATEQMVITVTGIK